ncbi:MAG: hypothetical protein ACRDON_11665 [Gaiellaceae bacterium]
MSRLVVGSLLVGGAMLAAGCGGGGGGGGERLSLEELITQADAICAKYEEQLNALETPQSLEDVERLAEEGKPIVEEGVNELKALEPPEDLEDEWDKLMEQNDANVALIDELSEAAASGDQARVQEVAAEAQRQDEETDQLAREIGLEECSND